MDNLRFTQLLDKLVASTRSPRGRYSAQSTWPLLRQRLHAARRKPLTLFAVLCHNPAKIRQSGGNGKTTPNRISHITNNIYL